MYLFVGFRLIHSAVICTGIKLYKDLHARQR